MNKYNFQIKIGYQFRHNPAIKFIHKELKREKTRNFFDKISLVAKFEGLRKNSNYKNLFLQGKKYGSVYWELSHEIDLVNFIVGKPNLVFSIIKIQIFLK